MDLNIELLPWQQDVWADETRFKIVAAGRRTGKSRPSAMYDIVNKPTMLIDLNHGNRCVVKFGVLSSFLCLLYTSPSPRDGLLSRMPSSA